MRTSYSQSNTYTQCPQFWDIAYNQKWKPISEGASLYFGSAVDTAVMNLLENKLKPEDIKEEFDKRWSVIFKNKKPVDLFDNDNVVYSHADFDEHLLLVEDIKIMDDWVKELKLTKLGDDPVSVFKAVAKIKKNPYKKITDKQLKYFNRCSWTSLKRKGHLLLAAFIEQFYPKITKVHATQKYGKITDPSTGDVIAGYIDMILEIEGYDKPIIFDLKTAARPYDEEQIKVTEQLTLYAAFEAENYNTDLVGYVVLPKMISKESQATCMECGHIKTGRHQTCDNIVDEERCNGAWDESILPRPTVQVLVERKTPEQIHTLLTDYSNIVHAMKAGVVYKNTQKCTNWYGSKCPYYDYCHHGKTEGLKNDKIDKGES